MSEHNQSISRRTFVGCAAAATAAVALNATDPISAHAVTAAQKKAEANEALHRLREMESALEDSTSKYYAALDAQQEAQDKMEEAQGRIDEASGRISELQDHLGTRAKSMYKSGSSSFLDLLLGATSFSAFTQNWGILNNMNEEDSAAVAETKELRAEVQAEKDEYVKQEQIADEQAGVAKQLVDQSQGLVNELQSTYANLNAEAQELLAQEEEAARQEAARRVAAQQAQQAQQSSGGSSGSNSGSKGGGGSIQCPSFAGGSTWERAQNSLGCFRYSYGSTGPEYYDCSAFVSYCLTGNRVGRIGTTHTFLTWPRPSDPQPGDICVNAAHCGIYAGGGTMIHCSSTYNKVVTGSMHSGMVIVRRP